MRTFSFMEAVQQHLTIKANVLTSAGSPSCGAQIKPTASVYISQHSILDFTVPGGNFDTLLLLLLLFPSLLVRTASTTQPATTASAARAAFWGTAVWTDRRPAPVVPVRSGSRPTSQLLSSPFSVSLLVLLSLVEPGYFNNFSVCSFAEGCVPKSDRMQCLCLPGYAGPNCER